MMSTKREIHGIQGHFYILDYLNNSIFITIKQTRSEIISRTRSFFRIAIGLMIVISKLFLACHVFS